MIDILLALSVLLFWIGLAYFGFVRMRTLLAYFQQEEYDAARFFVAWRTIRLYDVLASILLLAGFVFALYGVGGSVLLPIMALAFYLIARRERRYRFKKPLSMTDRARRLYQLALGLALVILLADSLMLVGSWFPMTWLQFLIAIIIIQFLPLMLVLANAILRPEETKRNNAFIAEAVEKLAGYSGVRIGVTGSFGKTSVKHILGQMLTLSGPVFYSRGSINTVLGLTRHIRQRLQPSHRYFIAEMGASGEAPSSVLPNSSGPRSASSPPSARPISNASAPSRSRRKPRPNLPSSSANTASW